jgi:hypothetical protein
MNPLLPIILFAQPILPELPPPPELEPPLERPVVVPLEHDTLGVGLAVGSAFGFELLARQDSPLLSNRSALSLYERTDHFHGMQQLGKALLTLDIKPIQVSAEIEGIRFENFASLDELEYSVEEETPQPRFYADASLEGFWHRKNLLAGIETQAYSSTMSGSERSGGETTARVFADMPWGKLLSRTEARLDPEGIGVLTDAIFQYQAGFMLITPSVQGRVYPNEDALLGAGACLNLLALIGTLSLEFEGFYHRARPLLLDSVLLGPVNAGLAPDVQGRTLTDQLRLGAGFEGVEISVFTEQGEGVFWQQGDEGLAELASIDFSQTGGEVGAKLERGRISLVGNLRFFFAEPETPWTSLWEFSDSMSVKLNPFQAFVLIEAMGQRGSEGAYESSYALLGCGVLYEREPFRVLLRADDLLDHRPQLWPGLPDAGRRFTFAVSLFSTDW